MAKDTIYINFSSEINQHTAEVLMGVFAQEANKGVRNFYLLLSGPGGNVMSGITVYNFLRSLPINLTTHNIGIMDSITNIVYLAGSRRFANYDSSFFFHEVGVNISEPMELDEENMEEQLEVVQRNKKLIVDILVERTGMAKEEAQKLCLEPETLSPEEAQKLGIVHEIKDAKIPEGEEVVQLVF